MPRLALTPPAALPIQPSCPQPPTPPYPNPTSPGLQVRYLVEPPPEGADPKRSFKYPFTACEIFCCEVEGIFNTLLEDEALLARLFSLLQVGAGAGRRAPGCTRRDGAGTWQDRTAHGSASAQHACLKCATLPAMYPLSAHPPASPPAGPAPPQLHARRLLQPRDGQPAAAPHAGHHAVPAEAPGAAGAGAVETGGPGTDVAGRDLWRARLLASQPFLLRVPLPSSAPHPPTLLALSSCFPSCPQLVDHVDTTSIAEVLVRLVGADEQRAFLSTNHLQWLSGAGCNRGRGGG